MHMHDIQADLPLAMCSFERVPLRDTEEEPIAERFQRTHDFIEDARTGGGRVLLHCHEGVSRSVTLAMAYLMLSQVSMRHFRGTVQSTFLSFTVMHESHQEACMIGRLL